MTEPIALTRAQVTANIAVTIPMYGEAPRHLLRTAPIPAGQDVNNEPLTIHLEISGDPLPHGPDEMQPTLCINRDLGHDLDQAFIEIDDPDALDQLIESLITAAPILRQLRKEAGL